VPLVLAAITILGFVLRIHLYERSLIGDELSTLWIVRGNGLIDTLKVVKSNAEITPPLGFVFSWFTTRIGDAPELVRLPALIAGTATIPLVYLLGRWTVGIRAGMFGATIFALSPFMGYMAANGRSYSLMVLFLTSASVAMLWSLRTGNTWGWVGYGVLSCLAMYSHYTAAFVLVAQLAWLLVVHPPARVRALLANVLAAVLFTPWIPGVLADFDSPTTKIMEAIQGTGVEAKFDHVRQWAFGHQLLGVDAFPGTAITLVICAGLLLAVAGLVARRASGGSSPSREVRGGFALLLTIALAAPLLELLLIPLGTDLLGSRNMVASWYGFAAAAGAVIALPGGLVTLVSAVLVLGGYGAAAVKLWGPDGEIVDFKAAASLIDAEAVGSDPVVDIVYPTDTPTPLTPLVAHMSGEHRYHPVGLPVGDPPFHPFLQEVPPPDRLLGEAFEEADGGPVYLRTPWDFEVRVAARGERVDNANALAERRLVLPAGTNLEPVGGSGTGHWKLYRLERD